MRTFAVWIRCLVVVGGLAAGAAGVRAADDANEAAIRRDLASLETALQATDPTAWVYWYTEDAMFVGPGEAPVRGRAALLEMAKAMTPLRGLRIIPVRIESSGTLAYAFARGQWLGGKPGTEQVVRVRTLLALRREADGHWRVAQELMHEDPEPAKKE